ncbi:MAG TPA: hypothetical protein VKB93_03255, partial [Thermoanaerobaculia bacterium]|nr:hypothetical protein [Thermoanaerobaculia bacterium]
MSWNTATANATRCSSSKIGVAVYSNALARRLLGKQITDGERAENLRDRYSVFIAGTDIPYPTARMPIVRALHGERVTLDDM